MMREKEEHMALRLQKIQGNIHEAASRSGRADASVRIVAISKGQSVSSIQLAYNLEMREFGENRVKEGLEKITKLENLGGIVWHMVGHIQSRKAKEIPANFHIVHSVDRLKIARQLNRSSEEAGVKLPVFIECNTSGEESKSGWSVFNRESWGLIYEDLSEIEKLPNLSVQGFMTMAPWVQDDPIIRTSFSRLREFRDDYVEYSGLDWKDLSMGMTDDYAIAVEEGATVVRIGRAIFGERGAH
jgi:pyridoxal phosphate enzyme (YggS family)